MRLNRCHHALFFGGVVIGCATAGQRPTTPPLDLEPTVTIEMEPIKIEAVRGPAGLQVQSFDAEELFEQGGKALSDHHHDEAIGFYQRLIEHFPASQHARPALYNKGLAERDKKDFVAATASFKSLAERYPDHADAKDALFQLGACFAELSNWPTSAEVFARILDRKDLNADDRVEALARRGFAQWNLDDLDGADRIFRQVLAFKQSVEGQERLSTDFFLAFSQYHLGLITHKRFAASPIRLPEKQMDRDLDKKAALLLKAQRSYIETIKYGHPGWASAAGYQVGSLYEQLYDAFMLAPVPTDVTGEVREVYMEELHKKIRILLEKSLRWQRENLLMMERLGSTKSDWAEKSKASYAKILHLLDPAAKLDPAFAPQAAPVPAAPPPPPPTPAPGSSERAAPQTPKPEQPERQIL